MNNGSLWQHNANENGWRGYFYNIPYDAVITTVLNDGPSSIKNFNTLNYEGSQARVYQYDTTEVVDGDNVTHILNNLSNHNLNERDGWYCGWNSSEAIFTNIESGSVREFIEKEGKWFNYIRGANPLGATFDDPVDRDKLNFQGLGVVLSTED